MFILNLNDMRSSQAQTLEPVAKAETQAELKSFLERERASEAWPDGQWYKVFKQGSVLEWYNEPFDHYMSRHFEKVPSKEKYIELMQQKAAEEWEAHINNIPDVRDVQKDPEVCLDQGLTGTMLKHQAKIMQIRNFHSPARPCSLCNYLCSYILKEGEFFYDAGCHCTTGPRTLEPRSWDDLAQYYNQIEDAAVFHTFNIVWGLSS